MENSTFQVGEIYRYKGGPFRSGSVSLKPDELYVVVKKRAGLRFIPLVGDKWFDGGQVVNGRTIPSRQYLEKI